MKLVQTITLCFAFSLFTPAKSQDTLHIYYDKNWKETTKEHAVFHRNYFENKEHIWTVLDYYSGGQLQMSGFYIEKEFKHRTGEFFYYYESGKTQSHIHYINDSTQDFNEGYFENGKLQSRIKTVNGKDTLRRYYEDGTLEILAEMKNSIQNGVTVYYHPNGKLSSQGAYLNGYKTGEWKYYDEKGKYLASEFPVQTFELPCGFILTFNEDRWLNFQQESHNVKKGNFTIDLFIRKGALSKSGKEVEFTLNAGCYHNIPDERMTATFLAESIIKNSHHKAKKLTTWNGNSIKLNHGVLYSYADKSHYGKNTTYMYVKREDDIAMELFFVCDPSLDEKFLDEMFEIIQAVEYKTD